jgi:hypothetical protein
MDFCQASYALGTATAARSSLASAQRALQRLHPEEQTDADARALLAIGEALCLVEMAIHDLGSEVAAHQLRSRVPA